jgi:hypothetical protein
VLQAVLRSLHQHRSGSSSSGGSSSGGFAYKRALLSSPLLLSLLGLSTELLRQPAAADALGAEGPLLVLEVLSHIGSSGSSAAAHNAAHCRALWRHAHAALGDAADVAGQWELVNADILCPEMLVRYYEACARSSCAGAPSKSRGLGLMLRGHLRSG